VAQFRREEREREREGEREREREREREGERVVVSATLWQFVRLCARGVVAAVVIYYNATGLTFFSKLSVADDSCQGDAMDALHAL